MSRCTQNRRQLRSRQRAWYRGGPGNGGALHLLHLERRRAIRMAEKHLESHQMGICSQCGLVRIGFVGRILRTHLDLRKVARDMGRFRHMHTMYHARRKHW
jgi:hypothetical protein